MTELVISPTYDTYLASDNPDTAYGSEVQLLDRHGYGTAHRIALFYFDLSDIPESATIDSAVFYIYSDFINDSYTHNLYRLLSDNSGWNESSTWNYKTPSSARWAGDTGSDGGADAGCQVSGTDYSTTSLGSFSVTAYVAAGTQYTANLNLDEFAEMRADNRGFRLTGSFWENSFSSRNHYTSSIRPKLVINYTEGAPATRTRIITC